MIIIIKRWFTVPTLYFLDFHQKKEKRIAVTGPKQKLFLVCNLITPKYLHQQRDFY